MGFGLLLLHCRLPSTLRWFSAWMLPSMRVPTRVQVLPWGTMTVLSVEMAPMVPEQGRDQQWSHTEDRAPPT